MTLVAVVLHLIDGSLAQGEIAGWIESTATGERTPIRDRDELIAVLVSLAIRRPPDPLAHTGAR